MRGPGGAWSEVVRTRRARPVIIFSFPPSLLRACARSAPPPHHATPTPPHPHSLTAPLTQPLHRKLLGLGRLARGALAQVFHVCQRAQQLVLHVRRLPGAGGGRCRVGGSGRAGRAKRRGVHAFRIRPPPPSPHLCPLLCQLLLRVCQRHSQLLWVWQRRAAHARRVGGGKVSSRCLLLAGRGGGGGRGGSGSLCRRAAAASLRAWAAGGGEPEPPPAPRRCARRVGRVQQGSLWAQGGRCLWGGGRASMAVPHARLSRTHRCWLHPPGLLLRPPCTALGGPRQRSQRAHRHPARCHVCAAARAGRANETPGSSCRWGCRRWEGRRGLGGAETARNTHFIAPTHACALAALVPRTWWLCWALGHGDGARLSGAAARSSEARPAPGGAACTMYLYNLTLAKPSAVTVGGARSEGARRDRASPPPCGAGAPPSAHPPWREGGSEAREGRRGQEACHRRHRALARPPLPPRSAPSMATFQRPRCRRLWWRGGTCWSCCAQTTRASCR